LGQKVNPVGLRLGIVKDWSSRWYGKDKYQEYLLEDIKIKQFIKDKLYRAGISKIEIERLANQIKIIIRTARPGIVIGRKGSEVEELRRDIQKISGNNNIQISVEEVPIPEIDAQLIAENIAFQLQRRVSYRRAMKQAISRALRMGAKGIKVSCAGRLAGAEIARTEWYREGRLPLQTLRADIDYGLAEAMTTYGKIGIKVWTFKGEVISSGETLEEAMIPSDQLEEDVTDHDDTKES